MKKALVSLGEASSKSALSAQSPSPFHLAKQINNGTLTYRAGIKMSLEKKNSTGFIKKIPSFITPFHNSFTKFRKLTKVPWLGKRKSVHTHRKRKLDSSEGGKVVQRLQWQ